MSYLGGCDELGLRSAWASTLGAHELPVSAYGLLRQKYVKRAPVPAGKLAIVELP